MDRNRLHPSRSSKYGNKRTECDGIVFASKREAKCYGDLLLLQRAGKITDLGVQVRFRIEILGNFICWYIADFVYKESGNLVVADAKGYRTDVYKLKRKLMKAIHGIEVMEI